MKPILFSVGPVQISSFGFFLLLSFILFTFLVWRKAKEKLYKEETIFDAVFFISFCAFLGARAVFILLNLGSFGLNLSKWILFTGYPGFEFYGGLVAALFALRYFFAQKNKKIPFWEMLDYFVQSFYPAYILAQFGVWLSGREVGKTAAFIFYDLHPVSLYRAVILLFFFLVLSRSQKKLFSQRGISIPGLFGLCLLFIFSLTNFLVDNLVSSEVYYLKLTNGQWVNLLLLFIYLYFIYRKIGYNLRSKVGEIIKKKDV